MPSHIPACISLHAYPCMLCSTWCTILLLTAQPCFACHFSHAVAGNHCRDSCWLYAMPSTQMNVFVNHAMCPSAAALLYQLPPGHWLVEHQLNASIKIGGAPAKCLITCMAPTGRMSHYITVAATPQFMLQATYDQMYACCRPLPGSSNTCMQTHAVAGTN